jgi:hypothetical protein
MDDRWLKLWHRTMRQIAWFVHPGSVVVTFGGLANIIGPRNFGDGLKADNDNG